MGGDITVITENIAALGYDVYTAWGTDANGTDFCCYNLSRVGLGASQHTFLRVIGSSYVDTIALQDNLNNSARSADPANYGNLVEGRLGGDVIEGSDDPDTSDVIYGGYGADDIQGLDGDDFIFGEVNGDYIRGGDGDDAIDGGLFDDVLEGNAGNDDIYGRGGSDTIRGHDGNDDIYPGDGTADIVYGGENDDIVYVYSDGATGAKEVYGGPGNDVIEGSDTHGDFLNGGDNNDDLLGYGGDDLLKGGTGQDDLYGGNDDDRLCGGGVAETDNLYGNSGADELWDEGSGAASFSTDTFDAGVDTDTDLVDSWFGTRLNFDPADPDWGLTTPPAGC